MKEIINQLRPVECVGFTRTRIGSAGDGGYVALKEICNKTDHLTSFGVGDDVSFEVDFLSRCPHIQADLYDPTVDGLPVDHSSFRFHKEGIETGLVKSLPFGTTLKIDVEGAEWNTLHFLPLIDLKGVIQILIEVHFLHVEPPSRLSSYFHSVYQQHCDIINDSLFHLYSEVLAKLNHEFYLFHIHPNNSLPAIEDNGLFIPPLLELSFVRKTLIDSVAPAGPFPVPGLDYPNKANRDDVIFTPLNEGIEL